MLTSAKVVLFPESFEEGKNVKNDCTLKVPKVSRIDAVLSLVRDKLCQSDDLILSIQ